MKPDHAFTSRHRRPATRCPPAPSLRRPAILGLSTALLLLHAPRLRAEDLPALDRALQALETLVIPDDDAGIRLAFADMSARLDSIAAGTTTPPTPGEAARLFHANILAARLIAGTRCDPAWPMTTCLPFRRSLVDRGWSFVDRAAEWEALLRRRSDPADRALLVRLASDLQLVRERLGPRLADGSAAPSTPDRRLTAPTLPPPEERLTVFLAAQTEFLSPSGPVRAATHRQEPIAARLVLDRGETTVVELSATDRAQRCDTGPVLPSWLRLAFVVDSRALLPLLAEPWTHRWPDGTSVDAAAGTPTANGAIFLSGRPSPLHPTVPLQRSHRGPIAAHPLPPSGGGWTALDQLEVGGLPLHERARDREGVPGLDTFPVAGSQSFVAFGDSCVQLVGRHNTENAVGGLLGALGYGGLGSRTKTLSVLPAGSPLFWSDGSLAGAVATDHGFPDPPPGRSEAVRCFPVSFAESPFDTLVGAAGPSLTVCARASAFRAPNNH